jgi:hypothetical protein
LNQNLRRITLNTHAKIHQSVHHAQNRLWFGEHFGSAIKFSSQEVWLITLIDMELGERQNNQANLSTKLAITFRICFLITSLNSSTQSNKKNFSYFFFFSFKFPFQDGSEMDRIAMNHQNWKPVS